MTANFDDDTLRAVGEIIALGEQEGFAITFEPDADGWTVGFMRGHGGGDLHSDYDLESAAPWRQARGSSQPRRPAAPWVVLFSPCQLLVRTFRSPKSSPPHVGESVEFRR